MTTLAEATRALAGVLGDVRTGKADSGTTSTLVDAAQTARAGILSPGTLWLIDCTQPDIEGLSVAITKHDRNTLHFATLSKTITAADEYAAFEGSKFEKHNLVKAINSALGDLPQHTTYNTATPTVAGQEEYSLPTGVSNVVSVEIALDTNTPVKKYSRHRHWNETDAGKLRFLAYVPALTGYTIRIGYNSAHAERFADADVLNPGVKLERLKYEAAAHALTDYLIRLDKQPSDDLITQAIQNALDRANAQESHNVLRESKQPTLGAW